MIKFPSLNQFRHVIKEVRTQHDYQGKNDQGEVVYLHKSTYPTLTFEGTVKIHGTCSSVVKYADGSVKFQSRERELSYTSDNAGFYASMVGLDLDKLLFSHYAFEESIAVFGEWCGQGIQKGVAVSELSKRFIIFAIYVDGVLQPPINLCDESKNIYNIWSFPKYTVKIDFNNPEQSQNELIEKTLTVEEECPVGKFFGVSGIGEGIVFRCVEYPDLVFKSKGEKHSSSKVKVLNAVDVEKLQNTQETVDYVCSENRMKQGLENVVRGIEHTGDFIRWVVNDILKEESDTLLANGIVWKDIASKVSQKARTYFINNL